VASLIFGHFEKNPPPFLDPNMAVNKLENALSIIRASKVVDDDRVQRTIKSLQEAIEDMGLAKSSSDTCVYFIFSVCLSVCLTFVLEFET
jgi:hypothetical protein